MAFGWKMGLGVVAVEAERWVGDPCNVSRGQWGWVWMRVLPCDAWTLGGHLWTWLRSMRTKINCALGEGGERAGSLVAGLSRCLPLGLLSEKNKPLPWRQLQSDLLLQVANAWSSDRTSILCQVRVQGETRNKTYCIPTLPPCLSWFVQLWNLHWNLHKTKISQCFDWSTD